MKFLKSTITAAILSIAVGLCGCGTRVVSTSPTEPVRLAKDIPNAPVWVKGADGKEVKATVTLKEGSYNLTREAPPKKIETAKEPAGETTPIPETPKAKV